MDPLIGTNLGPYTVTELIGEGGMAIVYKGYQESLNRYVALKVLRDELARDQQFVARFRQEALAAANLNHPNVVHVYDAGAANGKYFIAMAYVDGGTLKDLIHQGAIEPQRAVSITIQLAEALDHAHDHGLIHRDVKPNNVLMTRDGRPLLTDFGIAKALFEARQLTRTGTSIGTPEYMAPEQAQGQPPDGRTDIYALGVVLYEMLAARVPFCTDTPVATMYMHVHEPLPPLRQPGADPGRGAIPEWLEYAVCKALAKNPADRYQTAGLFAAALRQGQESMVAVARSAAPRPGMPAGDAPTAVGPAAAAGRAKKAPARVKGKKTPIPKRTPAPSSEVAASHAATAIGPSAAKRTPTPTPAGAEAPASNAATAIGPSAAAAAAKRTPTPAGMDAPTAIGPSAAAGATPLPAIGGAPAVAERKRRSALVPVLIAAIALLVIGTAVAAAVLLGGGGDGKATPYVTQVIIVEDQPTAALEATEEATAPATEEATVPAAATEEDTATPTDTLTPAEAPGETATATATATPSRTSTPTPTRTPTRATTATPTATATTAPTDTPVPPPTNTPVPPPTNTPVPPTNTPVPPTPTNTPVTPVVSPPPP